MSRKIILTVLSAIAVSLSALPQARATVWGGTLYYTNYTGGQNVWDVKYSYNDATHSFSLGSPTYIASTPGADGIIFAPNGNLLIGGQGSGQVFEVNPTTGMVVASAPPGSPGTDQSSYHLALNPNGNVFYTSDFGGALDTVPLPLAQGTTTAITGGDSGLTQIAFGKNGTVFYDNSSPNCCGNVGTIDLATGVTTRLYTDVLPAHGLIYDPYSGLMTLFGDGYTGTMSAIDGSGLTISNTQFTCDFDQGAVDGHGHALVAGCGAITFLDYSQAGYSITNPDYYTTIGGFGGIDDVAPLAGAGSKGGGSAPEPGTFLLFGAGLAGLALALRRRARA